MKAVKSHRHFQGFTLIELMIVVAILGVLLLVVTPNYSQFVADARVTSAKDKLMKSIYLARSEAIKRGEPSIVCRANNAGDDCAGSNVGAVNSSWSNGWLIFADLDDDKNLDAGELLRVVTDLDQQTTVQYSRGDMVVYDDRGLLETAAAGDQLFIIGDSAASSVETGVFMRSTGRVRSCADWDVSGDTCNDS